MNDISENKSKTMDYSSVPVIDCTQPISQNEKEIVEDKLYNIFCKYLSPTLQAGPADNNT